jgi:hypothetical protein
MNPDILDAIEFDENQVDIEAIMRQIRQHLAQTRGTQPAASIEQPRSVMLDREVYDALYEANQEFDKGRVTPYLTPSSVPLIGSLLQRVRARLHSLVVFYVDRAVESQIGFNSHVVRVLNGIVRGLDTDPTPDRVAELERRVAMLEMHLRALGERSDRTASEEQEVS